MKIKKLIALLLTTIIPFGGLVACGGGSSSSSLEITVYNAGYGVAWVEAVAAAFTEETGNEVVVWESADQSIEMNLIAEDQHTSDIIFMNSEMYSYAEEGHLADLTDIVYNKVPTGESDGLKTILERCYYADAMNLNKENKYYYVPFASGIEAMLYNETVLNQLFPTGWKANTTDEMFAMFETIKNSSIAYPMVSTSDYLDYLTQTWWAQYDGYDTYFDYWRGYKDGVFCSTSPEMAKTPGRLNALTVLTQAIKKDYGYMHASNETFFDSQYFTNAQMTFTGAAPFSGDVKKAAFYPCGDWFENEMGTQMNNQTIKMMKVPVISSIKNTFTDSADKLMTDQALSAIIDKIDNGVVYSESEYGCKQSTYERVKEARNIVLVNGVLQQAYVPVSSEKKELAGEFFRFMISNAGQSIFSQEMNGLVMPYGYDVESDENVEISTFARSVLDCVRSDDTLFVYRDISQTLASRGGIAGFTTNKNKYFLKLYTGEMTAQGVYDDTYDYLSGQWRTILTNCGF